MNTIRYSLAFAGLIAVACLQALPANALEALGDDEMGTVTGQEGVMISLDYYFNATKTDNPATSGQGLATCTDGGLADMDCRLAWQLENRGNASTSGIYTATTFTLPGGGGCDGQATCRGEWLVWKGGWMSLSVNSLSLDASFLGAPVVEGGAVSAGAAYEGFLAGNLVPVYGSFVDNDGNCLMPAGHGLTPCTVAYMKEMPALRTHYPGTSGTYSNATKASTGYNDVRFGLEVTGLSAEYDTAGVPGWQLNNGGSFTSLRIADNNGNQAGIAFGGNFYLYGF